MYNGPHIVTDGLILSFDAANNKSYISGSTTFNNVIRSDSGSLTNCGYDANNGGTITYTPAVSSSGLISVNPAIELTQITVNFWYYSNTTNGTALARSSNNANAFLIHYRGAGFYLVGSDSTVSNYLGWNVSPPAQTWNMLTGTWDGSTMKLYTNGIKQTSELSFTGGALNKLRSINTIQLGYYFNAGQSYTDGRLSTFTLYNIALTQDQILQNYLSLKSRFNL